ncbi:MAG: CD3324 family protein [Mobilitalea sp.]
MKYINAADVLPEELLKELQTYVKGDLLYVPNDLTPKGWGEKNGSRSYYLIRNSEIKKKYRDGKSISQISDLYGLAFDTVKKIIYS